MGSATPSDFLFCIVAHFDWQWLFFLFFYKVVIEKIKDRYRVYSSFRYMYVFFNFGFLLLFYSAQDGIGSPVTYELCIYNKISMQLIITKIKIRVSKVENYWEAILIFPRSNESNLGFGMQFWIQKCPASNPLYQNLYKRSRNFNSQSALQNNNFEWLYILLLSGSQCGHYDFVFSFLSKQTKKRFREEVKWGCFVGF